MSRGLENPKRRAFQTDTLYGVFAGAQGRTGRNLYCIACFGFVNVSWEQTLRLLILKYFLFWLTDFYRLTVYMHRLNNAFNSSVSLPVFRFASSIIRLGLFPEVYLINHFSVLI